MVPTIRIDEDVWQWLKSQARPLEDTANSVLRRVAGLEGMRNETTEEKKVATYAVRHDLPVPNDGRQTGRELNSRYRLGLQHALYHQDGTFFETLRKFPGGLLNPRGYVRYDSEEQFRGDSRIKIGRKVNVPGSISTHPRYQKFPERT